MAYSINGKTDLNRPMLYLTDNPVSAAPFPPRGTRWDKVPMTTLSEPDRALWAVFGGAATVHKCEIPVSERVPCPARRIVLVDHAASSQFDVALAALGRGLDLPDGLICLALEGARHRGQRSRPWSALRGNLHLTAHYRVDRGALSVESGLTMLPAVASARAIRTASDGRAAPGIKWVNDILLDGQKVSGVLTATHVQGATVERVLFGIGINVECAPDIEPTPFVPAAGSLSKYGISLSRVFNAVVEELDAGMEALRAEGSSALFDAYRDMADFIGRTVCIWPETCDDWNTAKPILTGPVRALLPDLSLQIEGQATPIRKGRMSYC